MGSRSGIPLASGAWPPSDKRFNKSFAERRQMRLGVDVHDGTIVLYNKKGNGHQWIVPEEMLGCLSGYPGQWVGLTIDRVAMHSQAIRIGSTSYDPHTCLANGKPLAKVNTQKLRSLRVEDVVSTFTRVLPSLRLVDVTDLTDLKLQILSTKESPCPRSLLEFEAALNPTTEKGFFAWYKESLRRFIHALPLNSTNRIDTIYTFWAPGLLNPTVSVKFYSLWPKDFVWELEYVGGQVDANSRTPAALEIACGPSFQEIREIAILRGRAEGKWIVHYILEDGNRSFYIHCGCEKRWKDVIGACMNGDPRKSPNLPWIANSWYWH